MPLLCCFWLRFTKIHSHNFQRKERYAQLLSRVRNTQKAMEDRKFHEEAIRKEISKNGDPEPLSPELYRMAAEMAAPYGWNRTDDLHTPTIMGNDLAGYTENRPSKLESPGERGEKAIPYSERGFEIEPRIRSYMDALPMDGAYITDKAGTYSMEDLQIMTAETGVEYAMLTIDGKSFVIRGKEKTTVIPQNIVDFLHEKKGSCVCHSHPFIGDFVPSESDRAFMKSLTWQEESIIIDPNGDIAYFNEHGVKEIVRNITFRDDDYYADIFK